MNQFSDDQDNDDGSFPPLVRRLAIAVAAGLTSLAIYAHLFW